MAPETGPPYGHPGALVQKRVSKFAVPQFSKRPHPVGNFAKEENTTIVEFFGNPSPVFGFGFHTMDDREGGIVWLVVERMALKILVKLSSIFEGLIIS